MHAYAVYNIRLKQTRVNSGEVSSNTPPLKEKKVFGLTKTNSFFLSIIGMKSPEIVHSHIIQHTHDVTHNNRVSESPSFTKVLTYYNTTK